MNIFNKYKKVEWTIDLGILGIFILLKMSLFTGLIAMLYLMEHKPEYIGNVLALLNGFTNLFLIESLLILTHFAFPLFFNLIVFIKKKFIKSDSP